MRLGAFEIDEPVPELNEPHALAMLQPWIDVGGVGTLTLSWLEGHFQAKEVGRLARPGNFFVLPATGLPLVTRKAAAR